MAEKKAPPDDTRKMKPERVQRTDKAQNAEGQAVVTTRGQNGKELAKSRRNRTARTR